jgi:hypothetical protein
MIVAKKNSIEARSGSSFQHGIPWGEFSIQHEKLAHQLLERGCEFASVLIVIDPLYHVHWENPKYMKRMTEHGASAVEMEARRRMTNRYPSLDQVEEWISEWEISWPAHGRAAKELSQKQNSKTMDGIFQAYHYALYPEILEDFKKTFKQDYRGKGFESAWEKEKIRLLSPTLLNEYKRVMNIPEPFNHWDSRNSWVQFYLVSLRKTIHIVQGGSASSSQRENHGRWAHVFASLGNRGIEAPTFCYRYGTNNEFFLEKSYEKFRCNRVDLTGNYGVEWSDTKHLFSNRLLSLEGGKIQELKNQILRDASDP